MSSGSHPRRNQRETERTGIRYSTRSAHRHLDSELPEKLCQGLGREMGVEPAGIWQHPNQSVAHPFGLRAYPGLRAIKGNPKSADTQNGYRPRSELPDLLLKSPAPGEQLLSAEFVGCGRGPSHEVGNAIAESQQLALFIRPEQAVGEARGEKRRPKPIARSRKMMAGPRRIEARIDAAKHNLKSRRDDIVHFPSRCGEQVLHSLALTNSRSCNAAPPSANPIRK